ncbi:MAG: hypothetical protein ABIR59_10645, partial [Gemmatimonadales bacterium]
FQHMIDRGRKILTAEVGGWYDCGQTGTTIETNGILLAAGAARRPEFGADVKIVEPVLIEDGCTIERSTIGPNVTLETGSEVRDSMLSNAIIGSNALIENTVLDNAMLGDWVKLSRFSGTGSIGSHSEVSGS